MAWSRDPRTPWQALYRLAVLAMLGWLLLTHSPGARVEVQWWLCHLLAACPT